jgi:hypothetical protein
MTTLALVTHLFLHRSNQCCGAFLTPGSGIRDPGWVKSKDPDSGSGMNNPDHISQSLETIFFIKILKFFNADPGSGMEKSRIRDKHPGSATLIQIHLETEKRLMSVALISDHADDPSKNKQRRTHLLAVMIGSTLTPLHPHPTCRLLSSIFVFLSLFGR